MNLTLEQFIIEKSVLDKTRSYFDPLQFLLKLFFSRIHWKRNIFKKVLFEKITFNYNYKLQLQNYIFVKVKKISNFDTSSTFGILNKI